MDKLEIKFRTWYKTPPPKPIKLEIPGWAGEVNEHKNGDRPQPWHCPPFVDGSTYGLELYYPFDTECHVQNNNGKIEFLADFSEEQKLIQDVTLPPFLSFAPGHFGMTSGLDIKVPSGYILRTEPHPRYYTDQTGTVPCCLAGHLQTEWWPKVFFVVFKNPMPGQTLVFRKGEPYGQVLVLPKKVSYDIKEMTPSESFERLMSDEKLTTYAKRFVKNDWKDHVGHNFDDKYKVLSAIFAKSGATGIKDFLNSFISKVQPRRKFKHKLLKKHHEGIQTEKTVT